MKGLSAALFMYNLLFYVVLIVFCSLRCCSRASFIFFLLLSTFVLVSDLSVIYCRIKTTSSIFHTSLFFVFICCCACFLSSLFLRQMWQHRIVRWIIAVFLSHPVINRFPVDSFIFFCCSTLFAIAFLCDLKYVSRMSVSDFKNIFRCTKRKSIVWSCFLLEFTLFLIEVANVWNYLYSYFCSYRCCECLCFCVPKL